MKRILKPIILMAAVGLIASCSKVKDLVPGDGEEVKGQFHGFKTYRFEPTEINLSSFDSLGKKGFVNRKKQNSLIFLRDSVWANGTGKTTFYETTEIPAILPETRRKLYLGAIIRGDQAIDVDKVLPEFIPSTYRNPITMYANFPTDSISRTIIPSKSAEKGYIETALAHGGTDQIQSFTYEQSQFRKTEELKKSFGANLNLGQIFSVSYLDSLNNSTYKTIVRAEFTQENFSVAIEPPIEQPFLKDNFNMSVFNGIRPLIVSSVTYGRKGIFIMESDSSYTMVKNTLNVSLTLAADMLGISSKDSLGSKFSASLKLRLTKEQKATIENSRMKVYLVGPTGTSYVKAVTKGLEGFAEVLAGSGGFTKDNPGEILYYTLNYVDNFATFRNQFKINVAN
ncbi:thiol-activated cytolysin family protein [Sphingobacterium thalpophilum]|uniref:thiol-activated cytolysin family protein n=1 Tax=Sphingobacterium thalpophilum TaxID=259 RepID=UPI003C710741